MNWNQKLKNSRQVIRKSDSQEKADFIYESLKRAIKEGYDGKTFMFHITPDVGKILTEQGLAYKTYRESECDVYSFPFEESSVWVK